MAACAAQARITCVHTYNANPSTSVSTSNRTCPLFYHRQHALDSETTACGWCYGSHQRILWIFVFTCPVPPMHPFLHLKMSHFAELMHHSATTLVSNMSYHHCSHHSLCHLRTGCSALITYFLFQPLLPLDKCVESLHQRVKVW